MSDEKWKMLSDEILPLAEALCDIAERYELKSPSISVNINRYFNFSIIDDGKIRSLLRANKSSDIRTLEVGDGVDL